MSRRLCRKECTSRTTSYKRERDGGKGNWVLMSNGVEPLEVTDGEKVLAIHFMECLSENWLSKDGALSLSPSLSDFSKYKGSAQPAGPSVL